MLETRKSTKIGFRTWVFSAGLRRRMLCPLSYWGGTTLPNKVYRPRSTKPAWVASPYPPLSEAIRPVNPNVT
jgi:hypothetical protein